VNCSEARKILYPEPAKCAVTIEHAEALRHVRECSACAAHFADEAEWTRLLKEKAGVEPAPARLRRKLAALAEAPSRRQAPGKVSRRLLLAVVLALAASPAVWWTWSSSSTAFFRSLCEDHARYLDAEAEVVSTEPQAVEAWLRRATNLAVRVPPIQDAELLGGRLCFLQGKKAALVFYRKQQRPVSLFQFEDHEVSLRPLQRLTLEGVPVWRGSFRGYNLAAFKHRGMVYALVSDLREGELLEIALNAQNLSRGF